MAELDSVTIEGFKSIASVQDLKLGPINLLIGANGSGKSNFIGLFPFLQAIRGGGLQEYVAKAGGAGRVLHFGPKVTDIIHLHVSFRDGRDQYDIKLAPTTTDSLVPVDESVSFWDKALHPRPYDKSLSPMGLEAGISSSAQSGVADYVRRRLQSWRLYHFHDTSSASSLRATADLHDNRHLRFDGSNLPAFLYFLRVKHSTEYELIRKTIALAAPFFVDFQLEPQLLNPNAIRLEWKHAGSDRLFDAASLSDGTLRFIALATLFLQPEIHRPSVILVDEPELGLHPYAIELLASVVRHSAAKTQVIIATQSPLLLDNFSPEEVLVAERVGERTTFNRLEPAKLAQWTDKFSLGQLWEKNEIGGRPQR